MNPLIFRVFTLNSLSFSCLHYESIIFFVNSLHYLYRDWSIIFRKFSLYLLSLREITMDPISFREFTIYFIMLYDEITTWQLNNN